MDVAGARNQFVTQEEAAEMIELWTQMSGRQNASLLSLQDVREVLQISDAQIQTLLAAVRPAPVVSPPNPAVSALTVLQFLALTLSMFAAGAYALWVVVLFNRHVYVSYHAVWEAILGAVWFAGWLGFYARSIGRTLSALYQQVIRGPSQGTE